MNPKRLDVLAEWWGILVMAVGSEGRVTCASAHDTTGAVEAMQAHLRTVFAAVNRIADAHADFFEGPRQKRPRRTPRVIDKEPQE